MFKSSNGYMGYVKRKYNTKKVGFSGTLDPFATGCLIVATGQYPKLFQYLKKTPKSYAATLWLGANSESLDTENIDSVKIVQPIALKKIEEALATLQGELSYYPPKFSAKKINGQRAYDMARAGEEVNLKQITSTIYEIKLIHYTHPFVHFEAAVSEGTYIRSLGAMLSDMLEVDATLSSLTRLNEGAFFYDHEKALDPLKFLKIPQNIYTGDPKFIELGKKLYIEYFETKEDGTYWVETEEFFSVIEVLDGEITYKLNRVHKFKKD